MMDRRKLIHLLLCSPLVWLGVLGNPFGATRAKRKPTPTPTPTPAAGFFDDFSAATLDTTKWSADKMPSGGWYYSGAFIQPQNATVADGELRLQFRREQASGQEFTTAVVHTARKYAFLHGRVEIRAKYTANMGLWPALWLQRDGAALGEPQYPIWEIDIVEVLGNDPDRLHMNVHHWDANKVHTVKGSSVVIPGLAGDWHTYVMDWTASAFTWSVDGVQVFSLPASQMPAFTKPLYLILNNGGNGWPNSGNVVDATTMLPDDFEVDYVRVTPT